MPFALLFPGQGSQTVGMGRAVCEAYPEARATYDAASARLGYDIARLCFEGPPAQLDLTEYTQPALLTTSVAILRVVERHLLHGRRPHAVAGHSLGEYTALIAAGGLQFDDAVHLVRLRGQFMQSAVPAGTGMVAAVLGLDRPAVEQACTQATGLAVPVNFNAPGQVVIAGEKSAVEETTRRLQEAGARVMILPVSVPVHCALMEPAARQLAEVLKSVPIAPLSIPLMSNVDARLIRSAEDVRDSLVRQLASPVLWEDGIRQLIAQGMTAFLEVGPGRVLTGLMRRIDRTVKALSIQDLTGLPAVEEALCS